MPILKFSTSDSRMGNRLAENIEKSTGFAAKVAYDPETEQWEINTEAPEADVRSLVESHDGTPEPHPDEEFRNAIRAANSLAELKAALIGETGPGAEPNRPDR